MNKVEDNPLEEIFCTDYLCQRSLEINPSCKYFRVYKTLFEFWAILLLLIV